MEKNDFFTLIYKEKINKTELSLYKLKETN